MQEKENCNFEVGNVVLDEKEVQPFEIVKDNDQTASQKAVGHVVEEVGEEREPIKLGQKFLLNGHLFKVKGMRKKDLILRLYERLGTGDYDRN